MCTDWGIPRLISRSRAAASKPRGLGEVTFGQVAKMRVHRLYAGGMAHTPLSAEDIDRLTNQPPRVEALRKAIFTIADGLTAAVDLSRIYVDGLENLRTDGRFLLVGNHTSAGWPEIVLTPYFVHRHLGVRVRGLADQRVSQVKGLQRDIFEAVGAVPGQPDVGAELMRFDETILVFPGGGRDMLKFKGEEYQLN